MVPVMAAVGGATQLTGLTLNVSNLLWPQPAADLRQLLVGARLEGMTNLEQLRLGSCDTSEADL